MAALNIGRATNTVTSLSFYRTVALIVLGSMAATVLTDWARDNVVDIGFAGGDALYAVFGAMLTMAVVPRSFSNPLATGMAASGATTVLSDYDVV